MEIFVFFKIFHEDAGFLQRLQETSLVKKRNGLNLEIDFGFFPREKGLQAQRFSLSTLQFSCSWKLCWNCNDL